MDKNCIFCKIVAEELDSAKLWEDDKFLAIMDLHPNTHGMTVIMPKKHHDSYVVDMTDKEYSEFFLAAKKVAKLIEKGLKVKRVAMVMEGMGVNHAHIKLYPLHGLDQVFEEMWTSEREYFETYQGYISTKMGPQKTFDELKKLASEIKKNSK